MGGVLSCCEDDIYVPSPLDSGRRRRDAQRQQQRESNDYSSRVPHASASTSNRRPVPPVERTVCDVCGCTIDPALFSGHRETCRINYARKDVSPPPNESPPKESPFAKYHDEIASNDAEACVVCYERMRAFAFIPCGHVACCMECSKKLDACPVCRMPREGLCYVDHNAAQKFRCKHCNQIIMPTLFDGHREVCGLRMRQLSMETAKDKNPVMKKESTNDDGITEPDHTEGNVFFDSVTNMTGCDTSRGHSSEHGNEPEQGALVLPPPHNLARPVNSGPTNTSGPSSDVRQSKGEMSVYDSRHTCVECQAKEQLVVLTPCGHTVLCYSCASAHSSCPLCMSSIANIIRTFH